jgi:hypothetical protein
MNLYDSSSDGILVSLFLRRADRDRVAFSNAPKLIMVEAAATAAYVGLGAVGSLFARLTLAS